MDRLDREEGKTFQPDVLFLGGDGDGELAPNASVTAKVVGHERGPKVRIGKYKPKSGYKRPHGLPLLADEDRGHRHRRQGEDRAPAKKSEAAAAPAEQPEREAPKGLPKDYADMTVAQVSEGAKSWNRPMLEAALIYEQEHAKRKGAMSALESALKAKEESDGT